MEFLAKYQEKFRNILAIPKKKSLKKSLLKSMDRSLRESLIKSLKKSREFPERTAGEIPNSMRNC